MAIFLGIDGGGTKTTCVVGDEIRTLGRGQGGPSNPVRVGEEKARESLHHAVREACASAQVSVSEVKRTCLGLAGGGREETSSAARKILGELLSGEIVVVGDMITTLEAAFGQGHGVIVIAGTGSIAYGRSAVGRIVRVGGRGYAVSDEGSAHWIGREAVSAALRAEDEGDHSDLLDGVQRIWGAGNREELILAANGGADFAALFPMIVARADAGDAVAGGVLNAAGRELARLARIVIGQLFADAQQVPVSTSGGVFRHSAMVREVFSKEVVAAHGRAAVSRNIVDPVEGALRMAREGHE